VKPGDVITDEPTEVGTVLVDRDGDLVRLETDGTWRRGLSWASVSRYAPLTVVSVPACAPEPAPAAVEWETVVADQVRVGDDIEVTHEGATFRAVFTGMVGDIALAALVLAPGYRVSTRPDGDLLPSVTIRRRVRTPMPEPEAPAVVRHAGRVAVRPLGDESDTRWLLINSGGDDDFWWKTWADLLALDPATDPVLVDLGGGE
jgi:hypothetical protein